MYMCVCVSECHIYVGPGRGQKGALDTLMLKLPAVVESWEVNAETRIWVFRKNRKLAFGPTENIFYCILLRCQKLL